MAITRFSIGSHIECRLKDTPDRIGVELTITGVFRSGGMSHEEIESRLREMLAGMDIDASHDSHKSSPSKG